MARFGGTYDWSDWVRGIMAGFVGGGAGAFTGGLSTLIIDPATFNFAHPAKVIEVMGGMFLVNGLISMMAFLHQNPVPQVVTQTTTQTIQKVADPPSVKVTTVEETRTAPETK